MPPPQHALCTVCSASQPAAAAAMQRSAALAGASQGQHGESHARLQVGLGPYVSRGLVPGGQAGAEGGHVAEPEANPHGVDGKLQGAMGLCASGGKPGRAVLQLSGVNEGRSAQPAWHMVKRPASTQDASTHPVLRRELCPHEEQGEHHRRHAAEDGKAEARVGGALCHGRKAADREHQLQRFVWVGEASGLLVTTRRAGTPRRRRRCTRPAHVLGGLICCCAGASLRFHTSPAPPGPASAKLGLA